MLNRTRYFASAAALGLIFVCKLQAQQPEKSGTYALQSATIEAARALGGEKESGSIAQGKRGDVLLLDADPLADIHNTRKVWRTVAAGAVYDPAPLWRSVDFVP